MKLTITTLTGEKYEVEVKAEDKVKDVKAQLYRAGRITSTMRLLHAQAPMEDDWKLSEYSLPEGAIISALFEPDVDVNLDVSCGHQVQKFQVSNATTIMALKVQICGVVRCGIAPEKIEIRLGDDTLEDPMPLHFYGIKDGSRLDVLKPYINVMIENNKGTEIYWRLNRKDTIGNVKVKLPKMSKGTEESLNADAKVEQYRLYLVTDGQNYNELDNNKTVENCKIKEDDKLFLLFYTWTKKLNVTVKKTGRQLWGLEPDDSFLGIKLKTQDQAGMPVNTFKLARLAEYKWGENPRGTPSFSDVSHDYVRKFKQLTEINDEELPFNYKPPLSVVTEEDLQEDGARLKEEEKAWREEVRKAYRRRDYAEKRKLGYQH